MGGREGRHAPKYPIDKGDAPIVAGSMETNLPPHLFRPRVALLGGILDVEGEEVSPLMYEPIADAIGPIGDVTPCPSPDVGQRALARERVGHARQKHDEGQAAFNSRSPGRNGTRWYSKGRLGVLRFPFPLMLPPATSLASSLPRVLPPSFPPSLPPALTLLF